MKKSIFVILGLVLIFLLAWALKTRYAKTTANKEYHTKSENVSTSKNWWDSDVDVTDDWRIDDEIPENYVPIPGKKETYMVIDIDTGEIKAYRKREKTTDPNGNIVWNWSDIENNISKEYEPVEGLIDIYKKSNSDGTVTYYRYIRNSDGTYAFIEVNADGSDLNIPSGKAIPQNYRKIIDNYYSVYNDAGVIIGYKKRTVDKDGNNIWETIYKEDVQAYINAHSNVNTTKPDNNRQDDNTISTTETPVHSISDVTNPSSPQPQYVPNIPNVTESSSEEDTYTEVKTSTTTDIKGNYRITYATTITKVYDINGKLVKTITDGPNEVSRELIISDAPIPDKTQIKPVLDEEYKRVTAQVLYNDNLINEIFISLNADRKSNGLPMLTLDQSGDLYKMSRIKAADMAIYNHADFDSPMYGTLTDLASIYGVQFAYCSESLWKTTEKTANEIHTRFQSSQTNRSLRMSNNIRKIAISIVMKDGYYYIYECYSD